MSERPQKKAPGLEQEWFADVQISRPKVVPGRRPAVDLGGFVFSEDAGIEVGMGYADGSYGDRAATLWTGSNSL